MKKRSCLSTLVLLSAAFTMLNGQDVFVSASFDTSRIYIGDQINYTVTVEQPSGLNLEIKPLTDSLVRNIEILSGPVTDTAILGDGRIRYTRSWLVTSFDSGMYRVPPFYAELSTDGGIRRFHSDYSFLEVMRVNIAPQDTSSAIFDIVEPYRAPVTFAEILPWALIAVATGLIIWGAVILLRRFRKPRKIPEVEISTDPAHVTAFRKLEMLREEQLWQKGEVKPYYSKLSEILREYIDNRYEISSLEMTTSETLQALLKSGFRKDRTYETLSNILTGSDLVKFAKYKPEPAENDQVFQDSWQFVDVTRQTSTPPDPETGLPVNREVAS
ncbi:MAG TPA: hypothetical protein PLV06_02365 [Bacteroidales bacterium]|nr:hypothetical protein [Bacteroidales bacterium]HPF04002.1 hypothetical protein [Bacteroidales bacterium]HPJ58635.1 hypothetical protein [Bacteroidales bacterium]HPR11206.1 hypothetical protein [Bacteroidales bacterium]